MRGILRNCADAYLKMVFSVYAASGIHADVDSDYGSKTKAVGLFGAALVANLGSVLSIVSPGLVDAFAARRNLVLLSLAACSMVWAFGMDQMLERYKSRFDRKEVVLLDWYRRYHSLGISYLVISILLGVSLFVWLVVRAA
jgi:hypothetical protein